MREKSEKVPFLLVKLKIEHPLDGEGFRWCESLCYFDHRNPGVCECYAAIDAVRCSIMMNN